MIIGQQQVHRLFYIAVDRNSQTAFLFSLFFCTLILLSYLSQASLAYAQIENAPAFQESYWTENAIISSSESSSAMTSSNGSIKKEVGPGDGSSTLAIVLVNKARSELTGVTGYLTLPPGFRAIRGENSVTSLDVAVASHASIIKPGESFILYFTINVLKEAKVGAYEAPLELSYSKVLVIGQISSTVSVPFRITGEVILDAISTSQNFIAGSSNELKILIKNEGSADANGVTTTIADVTDGTTTTGVSDIGNDDGEDDSGNKESDTNSNATASTKTDDARAEELRETDSQSSAINLRTRTFNVGTIPAGGFTTITPIIYPSYSSDGTIQTLDLEISYNDAYGIKKTEHKSVGIVISPNPPESVLSISQVKTDPASNLVKTNNTNEINKQENDSILLRAGKIEDVGFLISNNGDTPLKNVVLSLDSPSDSVKILGNSRWTFRSMAASSEQSLSTQVFAAEDVIATPIEFTLDAEYISGGQSKTDSLSIGSYIDGEIKIKAYDFAVNDIGGTPNLIGNLLNQGNTVALFTTVEMINIDETNPSIAQRSRPLVTDLSPQQYLGDLSENSPLPFSIPLNLDKDIPKGTYPVSIRVTYVDNLRNTHMLILNGTVNYTPERTDSSNADKGFLGLDEKNSIAILVVLASLIAGLIFVLVRRKRRKGKSRTQSVLKTPDRSDENNGDNNFELFDEGSSSRNTKDINSEVRK